MSICQCLKTQIIQLSVTSHYHPIQIRHCPIGHAWPVWFTFADNLKISSELRNEKFTTHNIILFELFIDRVGRLDGPEVEVQFLLDGWNSSPNNWRCSCKLLVLSHSQIPHTCQIARFFRPLIDRVFFWAHSPTISFSDAERTYEY